MKSNLFSDTKYQEAASKCLTFILNQFNVSGFSNSISLEKVYDTSFYDHLLYGSVTGQLPSSDIIDERNYVSLDESYKVDYTGTMSGSSTGSKVFVYEYYDSEQLVGEFEVINGRWETVNCFKHQDIFIDDVFYTSTEVQVSRQEYNPEKQIETQEYQDPLDPTIIHTRRIETTYKLVNVIVHSNAIKMVYDNNNHCARRYYNTSNEKVNLYTYAEIDKEQLNDECTIYLYEDDETFFFTLQAFQGHKIFKVFKNGTISGLAGGIADSNSGNLPAAFDIPSDDPLYDRTGNNINNAFNYLRNSRTYGQDIGLSLLVLTTANEYEKCSDILKRLSLMQNNDGSFNQMTDTYIGDIYDKYVRTNDVAWIIWGCCYYVIMSGDTDEIWLTMIKNAGKWLVRNQSKSQTDEEYGLVTEGYGNYDFDRFRYQDVKLNDCFTDSNCAVIQALCGLSLVFEPDDYYDFRDSFQLTQTGLMIGLYDRANKRFLKGIGNNDWEMKSNITGALQSHSCINSYYCEDCLQTINDKFGTVSRSIIQSTDVNRYNQKYSSDDSFDGFKPYYNTSGTTPSVLFSECTLEYVLACLKLGFYDEGKSYVDEIVKLQNADNCSGGILQSTATYAEDPYNLHVWENISASSLLYLTIKNPYVVFPMVLRQVKDFSKVMTQTPGPGPIPPGPIPVEDPILYKFDMNTFEIDRTKTLTFKLGRINSNSYSWSFGEHFAYGTLDPSTADEAECIWSEPDYEMWNYYYNSFGKLIDGTPGRYFMRETDDPSDPEIAALIRATDQMLGGDKLSQALAYLPEGYGWSTGNLVSYDGIPCYIVWYVGATTYVPWNRQYHVYACYDSGSGKRYIDVGIFLDSYFSPTFYPQSNEYGMMYFIDESENPSGKLTTETLYYNFAYPYALVEAGYYDDDWEFVYNPRLLVQANFFDGEPAYVPAIERTGSVLQYLLASS